MRADRRKYPHRTLGKYLWLRDLIHLTRYGLEKSQGRLTAEVVGYCKEAIEIFEKEFLEKPSLYSNEGLDYYSEANRILNKGFEVLFMLSAAPFNVQPNEAVKARFSSLEAWNKMLKAQTDAMVGGFTGKYA